MKIRNVADAHKNVDLVVESILRGDKHSPQLIAAARRMFDRQKKWAAMSRDEQRAELERRHYQAMYLGQDTQ